MKTKAVLKNQNAVLVVKSDVKAGPPFKVKREN